MTEKEKVLFSQGPIAQAAVAVILCLWIMLAPSAIATADEMGEPNVERYSQQLSRIREAGLEHIHGPLSEKKRSEILAGARRDMRVRVYFHDKALRAGYKVTLDEIAAFRQERTAMYVTEQALRQILDRAGVSEQEHLRLLEIEFLANRYTRETILPGVRIPEDQIRTYYRENLRSFWNKGHVLADIVSVASTEWISTKVRNEVFGLAEAAKRERVTDAMLPVWEERIGGTCQLSIRRDLEISASSGMPYAEYYREIVARKEEMLFIDRDPKNISIVVVVRRVKDGVVPFEEVKESIRKVLEREAFEEEIWKQYREGHAAGERSL